MDLSHYQGITMSNRLGSRAALALVGAVLLSGAAGPRLRGEDGTNFQQRRTALVEKHDKNADGRLDAAERELMRLAMKEQRLEKAGSSFKIPPEFLAKYDANKDGEMQGDEWRVAWEAETKILREAYDADKDGSLNKEERQAMMADVGKGKITGIPAFFAGRMVNDPGSAEPTYLAEQQELLRFDADGDGLASADELARIREAGRRAELRLGASPGSPPQILGNPAPRGSDSDELLEAVSEVKLSRRRGLFDEPFELTLTTKTDGAVIRYTTNGSTPTLDQGVAYRSPLKMSKTTVLRVTAFKPGLRPTKVKTHTFLFPGDVIHQSPDGLAPEGFPYRWGKNQVDYGMDPRIVNDPRFRDEILAGLKALPSFSLVTEMDSMFGAKNGVYSNPDEQGRESERPCSLEMLRPDGKPGFQINCGIRIRGGFSRLPVNVKHAFRLFFRSEYGPSKLKFPLFGEDGAQEFENLDLRTPQNYSWSLGGDTRGTLIRDQFNRDLQLAMGQPAARGNFCHLYINGHYWGIYNTCERIKASYGATYLGGKKSEYDVVKVDSGFTKRQSTYTLVPTDGNMETWTRLYNRAAARLGKDADYFALQGRNPDGTANPAFEPLLDVDNLISYMLIILWGGNLDAPISAFGDNRNPNNFHSLHRRHGAEGFRFFIWDAEHTMLNVEEDRTGPFKTGERLETSSPQWLWQQCVENAEFRMRVADLVYRYAFNGGILSPGALQERFLARAREIESAVIAESARWGDVKHTLPMNPPPRLDKEGNPVTGPFNRDDDWRREVNRLVKEYLPKRTGIVLGQLFAQGLLPDIEPPRFIREGSGGSTTLAMKSATPDAVTYYTTDGTDPRIVGGTVSPRAVKYTAPVSTGANPLPIKARARINDDWSPLAVSSRVSLEAANGWSPPDALSSLPAIRELPNVFTFADGSTVRTPEDWPRRREELKAILLYYQYGNTPPRPDRVVKIESQQRPHESGLGTVESMVLEIDSAKKLRFRAVFYLPKHSGRRPVLIREEDTIGQRKDAPLFLEKGYIFVEYARHDLDPDRDRVVGTAQAAYPNYDWATLAVWAWCGMGLVDYLETRGDVDRSRIGITGHSRGGKMALLTAALDERISLVVPHQSGSGGAGCYRVLGPGAETLGQNDKPHWYHERLRWFREKEERLPFDQHFLKALIAPRALLCTESIDDEFANPLGSLTTSVAAQKVFEFLGAPEKNGIHFRRGGHTMERQDWVTILEFAEWQFFGREPAQRAKFWPAKFPLPAEYDSWKVARALHSVEGEPTGSFVEPPPATQDLEFRAVGLPGNPTDVELHGQGRYGAVANIFELATNQVAQIEYATFLNAVAAKADPAGLYDPAMAHGESAIRRVDGADGCRYLVLQDAPPVPATHVSWFDCLRFCNWLHNGRPIGGQGPTTTEDGAYKLEGPRQAGPRRPGARFFLPSEDEWYKAAYYEPMPDGSGIYRHFAPKETNRPLIESVQPEKLSPWGLAGLFDRVWEWTESPVSELHRSLRSGAWFLGNNKQSAGHFYSNPQIRYPSVGFRVARLAPREDS